MTAKALPVDQIDSTFKSKYVDLVSEPLGSRILAFSDQWFAEATNLIKPSKPIWKEGYFVHSGKWFDGWETRRHNPEPADWVIIRLGVASGNVAGAEIDTAFFTGNHAPEIAIEGTFASDDQEEEIKKPGYSKWETILSKRECNPDSRHGWVLDKPTDKAYTHVRLLMYPDGGIARFRLYGNAVPVFPQSLDDIFELSATVNGGVAISCSDEHFGTIKNLLLPGRGKDMGDGWETKRTRGEHIDWAILRLGAKGEIDNLVIDTAHFRGNFPQKVQVYAGEFDEDPTHDDKGWIEVLSPQKTGPDVEHKYGADVLTNIKGKKYTHAKLIMIPDGGIKRFRVFGKRAP